MNALRLITFDVIVSDAVHVVVRVVSDADADAAATSSKTTHGSMETKTCVIQNRSSTYVAKLSLLLPRRIGEAWRAATPTAMVCRLSQWQWQWVMVLRREHIHVHVVACCCHCHCHAQPHRPPMLTSPSLALVNQFGDHFYNMNVGYVAKLHFCCVVLLRSAHRRPTADHDVVDTTIIM